MFDAKELECLEPEYFNIIMADEYDVTVMSRNTGHYWYIHCMTSILANRIMSRTKRSWCAC